MNTTIVSGINTSGQARLHIGDQVHNEHHDHRYYGDESQLSPAERQRAREDAILSSLYFTDMSAREQAIDSPCDDTFGWIFDERVTKHEEYTHYQEDICNLMSRWLEHEHGMFFIVGKAGSGKSTLMRFLAGHKTTRKLLHSWAERRGCALAVHAHYFWCFGSQLQSSQEGLWRNILYAIAQEDRNLASDMFAKRAGGDYQTLAQLRSQPWARNELINAISLLVGQLEVQKIAFCLFIDGLDEYQGESGDEMMLIEELRQLLRSPYIKICASSRPRNLFEEAFGYKDYQWKLALHLLTRGDMVQLARTRLYKDDAFCKLVNRGDRRQAFITAITDKSQGVFLWTVLVVREMIREAHQAGTIDELKARLDELPIELGGEKGMYHRIVERSDPRYRKYMARLLLVMLEAGHEKLRLEDVHFLYDDDRDAAFATRECLGLDDGYRVAWDKKAETVTVRLGTGGPPGDASCRGLFLACHQGRSGAHPRGVQCRVHRVSLEEATRRQIRKWCPDLVDTNDVDDPSPRLLHRSVGEYLSLPGNRQRMLDLAGPEFDPVITICCLRLAYSRLEWCSWAPARLEHQFITMITCVGHERRDFVRAILPRFERIQDTKWSSMCEGVEVHDERFSIAFWAQLMCFGPVSDIILHHGGFDISHSSQADAWFLSLIAREGLLWYCRERWSRVPSSDQQATGIIIIAGLLLNLSFSQISREQIVLVQSLLCSGVNPNMKYTWIKGGWMDDKINSGGSTENDSEKPPLIQVTMSLWEAFVDVFSRIWLSEAETTVLFALEMMQLLLHDGRVNTKCCLPAGKKSFLSALTFEPHLAITFLKLQNDNWSMFAGRLHDILDAHGLLTTEERHIALEQGWMSTKLKAPHSPQTTPTQSATEPNTRQFRRWLRKFRR
jgi:hypothetical protein